MLGSRHAPLCQHILKKGNTPAPYRGALCAYVLGSHSTEDVSSLKITTNFQHNKLIFCKDATHWNSLKNMVLTTDHIVDKLVFKDVQLTASNDDQYFVFEDVLYQVMLCFSRDVEIAEMIQFESYPVKGRNYDGPPSGVVPFHSICMFGKIALKIIVFKVKII